jgi:hypothetical protein
MRSGVLLILLVYVAMSSVTGCASGERFGSNDTGEPGSPAYTDECETDVECYDANPTTYDFCDAYGDCQHMLIGDTDSEDEELNCETYSTVGHDMLVSLDVPGVVGELSYATPLSQGRLLKLSFRDPMRIRARPLGKDLSGILLVLLKDCANAAVNRISWGPSIYSSEVPGGDYYLAVFADENRTVEVDIHYLKVTPCDDAGNLETGEVTGTTDGYADDFQGSCSPTNALGEHRGDQVYTFFVPEGQVWDVKVDLFTGDTTPNHYLYMRKGCSGPDTLEIDCANEFVVHDLLDSSQGDEFMRIRGEGLETGAYYVFVDALPYENYNLGEYHIDIEFYGVGPR